MTSDDTSKGSMIYDAPAGTGGLLINKWDHERMKSNPIDYKPGWFMHVAEELSDRTIPFLLFNVMVRGMNAVVAHCDVLTRETFGVFFVQNDKDDHMTFSNLNLMPYPEGTPKKSEVPKTWNDVEGSNLIGVPYHYVKGLYDPIAESKGPDGDSVPRYLTDMVTDESYFDTPFANFIKTILG